MLQDVTGRLQTSANRVLTAVDWPPPAAQQPASNGTLAAADQKPGTENVSGAEDQHSARESTNALAPADSADSGSTESEQWLARWARQLSVFRFAMQDWTERLWQVHTACDVVSVFCITC